MASDAVQLVPNATLYEFGVLTSIVHNAWMRVVCGRLESRYRYSNDIVYNNFPWCTPTEEQKAKIEQTAQAILDARAKYPDSSLADLYDENIMPPELRKAHRENDAAVMKGYGFDTKITESECVIELFKIYDVLSRKV
ncbi:MAG: methylase [Treponema sp.]|nr:methylase [Treponema sp.]